MEGIDHAITAFSEMRATHPRLVAIWTAYLESVRRVALEAADQADVALREMRERPDLTNSTIAAIVALCNSA